MATNTIILNSVYFSPWPYISSCVMLSLIYKLILIYERSKKPKMAFRLSNSKSMFHLHRGLCPEFNSLLSILIRLSTSLAFNFRGQKQGTLIIKMGLRVSLVLRNCYRSKRIIIIILFRFPNFWLNLLKTKLAIIENREQNEVWHGHETRSKDKIIHKIQMTMFTNHNCDVIILQMHFTCSSFRS